MNEPATATPVSAPKSNRWRNRLILLCFVGILATVAYAAYITNLLDQYLPRLLQHQPVSEAPSDANSNNANNSAPTGSVSILPPSTIPNPSAPAPADSSAPLVLPPLGANPNNPATSSTTPTQPGVALNQPQPILPSSPAPSTQLLATLDALWQWQDISSGFAQKQDANQALSQIAALKPQLRNNPAALSAIAQVEGELNQWQSANMGQHISALEAAIGQSQQLNLSPQTANQPSATPADNGDTSWQGKLMRSIKSLFEFKRVEKNSVQTLSAAETTLVQHSIQTHLQSALWFARSGDWAGARQHANSAQTLARTYQSQGLSGLDGLTQATSLPTAPNFATVKTALANSRAQMLRQLDANPTPAAPSTNPPAKGL